MHDVIAPMEDDFQVGFWLVSPKLNRIAKHGRILHLEPKAMRVLVFLAEHQGEVVSRKQLIDAVWMDTFVTDYVLTHSISELRRAFDDDVKQPRFIETIPKNGYRLVAPVTPVLPVAHAHHDALSNLLRIRQKLIKPERHWRA